MAERQLKPLPPALPETVEDFRALRKTETPRNLNDIVEEYHLAMYNNEEYSRLLYAVYDEQAVEGSLAADNILAAKMLRERAQELKNVELSREKLATISKSLGIVLRRYRQSRKERRYTVHGEMVPADNE